MIDWLLRLLWPQVREEEEQVVAIRARIAEMQADAERHCALFGTPPPVLPPPPTPLERLRLEHPFGACASTKNERTEAVGERS